MIKNAITLIHDAARLAAVGSIDAPIYLDVDIGIDRFTGTSGDDVYVNVPVKSIFALGHCNFWEAGDTWRSATSNLAGEGWDEQVFNYFDHPLKENDFPAPRSRRELRLSTAGGLCGCTNGNHRLVAGRAWLTSQYGDGAQFQLVKVQYRQLSASVRAFLVESVMRGTSVRTAQVHHSYGATASADCEILLQRESDPDCVFGLKKDCVVKLTDHGNGRARKNFRPPPRSLEEYGGYNVVTTPLDVVKAMLDDAWILSQLANAERW